MEGGDESLEQATRNGVGLPASGVYRLRVYWPRVYRSKADASIDTVYRPPRATGWLGY